RSGRRRRPAGWTAPPVAPGSRGPAPRRPRRPGWAVTEKGAARMSEIANVRQADAWNGPEGAHWAERSRREGEDHVEITEALLDAARIAPHDRVLDVGCGTGGSTLRAARRAARGAAVGVDLSAVMLDQARADAAAAGVTNLSYEQGDAQVHPFPDGSF